MTSLTDARYFDVSISSPAEIRKYLDGKTNKEKLEGMKRLMALLTLGKDVSMLFPDVVKLVIVESLDVKKLVYSYLVHYAESKPEESLLCINTFQKDLTNKSAIVRGLALRTMSSIRAPIIVNLVVLSLQQCAKDPSPYVRKSVAAALSKVYALESEQLDVLLEILGELLRDRNVSVMGAAMIAFTEICPENLDMIHPIYRRLCKTLADTEEWYQVHILNVLLRYARKNFPCARKVPPEGGYAAQTENTQGFYSDDEDEPTKSETAPTATPDRMDEDLEALLRSAMPLLMSRNAAVVLSVVSLIFHVGPEYLYPQMVMPLLRLIRGAREVQEAALKAITELCDGGRLRQLFMPHIHFFYVHADDALSVRKSKIRILGMLTNAMNAKAILSEFQAYVRFVDDSVVEATIDAIAVVGARVPPAAADCVEGLIRLLKYSSQNTVNAAATTLASLLYYVDDTLRERVVRKFAVLLPQLSSVPSRASAVWAVGEYASPDLPVEPEVLRVCAKTFRHEDVRVKYQILALATKLFVRGALEVEKLLEYILELCAYDLSYDLRDHARMVRALVFGESCANVREKLTEIFLAPKPEPVAEKVVARQFTLGSLSAAVGQAVIGYLPLGEFPNEASDKALRDREAEITSHARPMQAPPGAAAPGAAHAYASPGSVQYGGSPHHQQHHQQPHIPQRSLQTLDAFYADDEPQPAAAGAAPDPDSDVNTESDDDVMTDDE